MRPRGVGVLDNRDDPSLTPRCHGHDPLAQDDRAGRTRRGELHEPDPRFGPFVMIRDEAELIDVEGLRPVDVSHGNRDDLKLHVHAPRLWVVPVSSRPQWAGIMARVPATATRLLALLDLLQTHRQWSGAQLAERLGASERTLRRDVDRLRELGYRVTATRGSGGGYRLEAGSALPPLLLTDAEAVTMALGLRTIVTHGLVDSEQVSLTALAKLEQVLPTALRRRVVALAQHVHVRLPGGAGQHSTAAVQPDLLGQVALACRDHERLRFHYVDACGTASVRVVEPHSLVASRGRWLLVAWDRDRDAWRSFRADRMDRLVRTGARDPARDLPAENAADYVAQAQQALFRGESSADVVIDLPVEDVRRLLGAWGADVVALGERSTRWPISFQSASQVVAALAWLPDGVGYRLDGDPALLAQVTSAAAAMTRAAATDAH